MKVGDKVVCIAWVSDWMLKAYPNVTFPEYNRTYTVRDIRFQEDGIYVGLTEIVNEPFLIHENMFFEPYWPVPEMMVFLELSELTDEMILTAPTTKELQTA